MTHSSFGWSFERKQKTKSQVLKASPPPICMDVSLTFDWFKPENETTSRFTNFTTKSPPPCPEGTLVLIPLMQEPKKKQKKKKS